MIHSLGSQIYLTDVRGEQTVAITSPHYSAWRASWSDDGHSVRFLSDATGETQLFSKPVGKAAEPVQISKFENGMASANLSPDGLRAIYGASDNQLATDPEDGEPQPIVVMRRHFRKDHGSGYIVDGDQTHLYVHDFQNGETKQITSGQFDENQPNWSPDGKTIAEISTLFAKAGKFGLRTSMQSSSHRAT